jgi:hypothetical protein
MSERLQYAHLEGGNLVVQLDGGGASQPLTSGLPVEQVVAHLRLLAATLERDAAQRQGQRASKRRPIHCKSTDLTGFDCGGCTLTRCRL